MTLLDSKSVFAYLTDSDASETVLMRFNQFMKLHEERKDRNIDLFELQVFQEQLSSSLKGVNLKKNFDSLSENQYKGLKKAQKTAKFRKDTQSLPKYVRQNLDKIEFGITTLPSDNMNMVMNNDFGADFVRKMHERKTIEKELEKIANMQQRNAKYNIYVTKA